jgi:hypothetical protein
MARTRALGVADGPGDPSPLDAAVSILAAGVARLIGGRPGSAGDPPEIVPAGLEPAARRALSVTARLPGGERRGSSGIERGGPA